MESLISNLFMDYTEENLVSILSYMQQHTIEDYISFSKTIIKKVLESTIAPSVQINILKIFIDLFFTSMLTKEQINLIPFRKIFDTKYSFYNQLLQASLLESYYQYYYPKEQVEYKEGDLIDYLLIENNDYMWTEAQITTIKSDSDLCAIKLLPTNKMIEDNITSFRLQPHRRFSEDQKWRAALAKGDSVDFLDRENNWYKVVVNSKSEISLNIGGRVSNKNTLENSFISQQSIVGHYKLYYIRIRQSDTFSFELSYPNLIPFNTNNNRKHNPHSMHIPYDNKHFVIPKCYRDFYTKYSVEYFVIGNYFIEKLLKAMDEIDNVLFTQKQSMEHFEVLCDIINLLHEYFHLKFARVFIRQFIQKALQYLKELFQSDAFDLMQMLIDPSLALLRNVAGMGYYEYEIEILFHKYEIEIGVLFAQNTKVNSKLFGLNLLITQLKKIQYDIFQAEKTAVLIQETSSIDWNQILESLFTTNYHKETVKRSTDLIKQLIKAKVISREGMVQIFKLASSKDSQVKNSIYELLTKHSYEIGQDNIIHLINYLFESFDPMTISTNEADLLLKLTQGINTFGISFFRKVIDYFFNLVHKFNRRDLMPMITELIISKHIWHDMIELFLLYIERIIDKFYLDELYDQFKFLSFMINSIPKNLEDHIRLQLAEIVFKKHQEKVANLLIDYCGKKATEDKMDILSLLLDMLQFTRNSAEFLGNKRFIEELFLIFVDSSIIKRNCFFNWMSTILEKRLMSISGLSHMFNMLGAIMDRHEDHVFIPYYKLISFYWTLFLQINNLNEKHLTFNTVNPFELKHSDEIWNLIMNSNERGSFYLNYIDLFALPYMNQTERSGIWRKMIDKILSLIKSSSSDLLKANYLKSLLALINISEYYGTANCIPHSFIYESSDLSLTVINSIIKRNDSQFTITIPSNITLYEFKQLISQTIGVNHHCFGIYGSTIIETEFSPKQNGEMIQTLLINDNINTVYLFKSQDLDFIPQERLTIDPWNYSPEAREVFKDVFNQFSTNGKMSREQLAQVITIALNLCQTIAVDNPNFQLTFNNYDTDRDNMITLTEFLNIYLETIRENNEDTVWTYLKNFNYRNDLRKISEPLKKEPFMNDKAELMPRHILSQESDYFQLLFNMQKEKDYDVSKNATCIINKIETNQSIYNEILSNCQTDYFIKEKDKDDSEIIAYSMRIMLTIFNNLNKENEAKCIQTFLSQSPFKLEPNVNTNVERNSSLQLLFELFFRQMKDLTYAPNLLMVLYMLELQLIQKSLLHLLQNEDINTLISHYSRDKETAITKIETDKISSVIKSNSTLSLSLDKAIRIISDNLPVILPQFFSLDTKMNIIKMSFQILLIALFAYGESELNSFMGIEFKNFLMNQFKIKFPYIQKLAYITIRIIFAQYQQDLPFLKSIEKNIMKEFRLIMSQEANAKDKDQDQDHDPSFLIKVYQDIIKLNDFSEEEKANVIDEFVSLANALNTSQEKILIGYFTILKTLIESTSEIESTKKIISIVLDKFLFGLAFSSNTFIQILFDLLTLFITTSKENLTLFYSHETITSLFNHITLVSPEQRFYNPMEESRDKIAYIGIKNLSAICYMNSVLQQFFQVKAFSYGINEVPKPKESDTVLYQLQRMYSYLELSHRKEYSPGDFVYSYKDINGKPTDFRDQCDAQEFLSRFLDQIEDSLKETHLKYLIANIFGGESCSQLRCLNSTCNKIGNRFEHLYYFSLDIKEVSTLQESLSKYIQEERIEDYLCEQCHCKGVHSKRVSFNRLPNVLFIHLQRISFNVMREENEKINSRLTFPKDLNLKSYCTETLQASQLDDDYFNANVYNKELDYYQYKLVGVIVHSGTGNFGHYYSLINISRDKPIENWIKFNDDTVSEYLLFNLEEDAFGGEDFRRNEWAIESNQSAYMLVYERIKKTNLSIVVDKVSLKDNVIEVKDKAKLTKLIDSTIPIDSRDKSRKSDMELIDSQLSSQSCSKYYTVKAGDNQLQSYQREYIEIIPYDSYCKRASPNENHKHLFYDEVFRDNIKLINDRKIYSLPFCKLIEASAKEISSNKELSEETVISLYKQIHSLVKSVIAKSYYKDNIIKIIAELIMIMKTRPLLIEYLINELGTEENSTLSFFIFTPDALVGEAFALYTAEILIASIQYNIQQKRAYDYIDGLLTYFPHKLVKKWSQMVYFLDLFKHLSKSGIEPLMKYLIDHRTILKMCEIYLGKDYPYYEGNRSLDSTNQSSPGKFSPLLWTIANLATYSSSMSPNEKEIKCLSCPQFGQKGVDNNIDKEALTKIITQYQPICDTISFNNNTTLSSTALRELVSQVHKANDYYSMIKSFESIKQMFLNSNENTESYLENLIGIMQISSDETQISYMAPLSEGHETILTKVIKSADENYFVDLVELFYDLLLTNPQIPRYISGLLPTCGMNIEYGIILEINEHYSSALILKKEADKNEAYKSKVENIAKLQSQLKQSLQLENKVLSPMQYDFPLMRFNIRKETVKSADDNILSDLDKLQCIKLYKSRIDLNIVNKLLLDENQYLLGDIVQLKDYQFYSQNNYQLYKGNYVTRQYSQDTIGVKNTIIRYFLVNDYYKEITVVVKFKTNSPNYPKSELVITLPMKSVKEVFTIRNDDDIQTRITVKLVNENSSLFNDTDTNNYSKRKQVAFDQVPLIPVNSLYSNSIPCPICNRINIISETETEFKCIHCTALLFQ